MKFIFVRPAFFNSDGALIISDNLKFLLDEFSE